MRDVDSSGELVGDDKFVALGDTVYEGVGDEGLRRGISQSGSKNSFSCTRIASVRFSGIKHLLQKLLSSQHA
jgi:hypothetical protein